MKDHARMSMFEHWGRHRNGRCDGKRPSLEEVKAGLSTLSAHELMIWTEESVTHANEDGDERSWYPIGDEQKWDIWDRLFPDAEAINSWVYETATQWAVDNMGLDKLREAYEAAYLEEYGYPYEGEYPPSEED